MGSEWSEWAKRTYKTDKPDVPDRRLNHTAWKGGGGGGAIAAPREVFTHSSLKNQLMIAILGDFPEVHSASYGVRNDWPMTYFMGACSVIYDPELFHAKLPVERRLFKGTLREI